MNTSGIVIVAAAASVATVYMLRRTRRKNQPMFVFRLDGQTLICEQSQRKKEEINIDAVQRIWLVTTSSGPWLPDARFLFEGVASGCSVSFEAANSNEIFDVFKAYFPGIDYNSIIEAGTKDKRKLIWERKPANQAL